MISCLTWRNNQKEEPKKMLSFELSAIDIILTLAVFVLLILYMKKVQEKSPENSSFLRLNAQIKEQGTPFLKLQSDYKECPLGLGNIKGLDEKDSVSERCLSCSKVMSCYGEPD